jgi:hypothetical protein
MRLRVVEFLAQLLLLLLLLPPPLPLPGSVRLSGTNHSSSTADGIYRGLLVLRLALPADDDVLTGRKTGEAGETFTAFGKGLYTDDAGLLIESRPDLELGARLLNQHLTRFGLVIHCGKMSPHGAVAKKSKTEAVFYPQAGYIRSRGSQWQGCDLGRNGYYSGRDLYD